MTDGMDYHCDSRTYRLVDFFLTVELQRRLLFWNDGLICFSYLGDHSQSQSVARPQGSGVTIATNVISIWQKPIRQKARNNVTHTRPSAGHQLLHVCARLLGHTETHSGFQRSFHISQIIRSGSKQNIQKGSVSRLPVCPFSYTAFSLNDIFSKIW